MNVERRFVPRELREVRVESREEGKAPLISGYGAVFYDGTPNTEYVLWDGMVERIMRGAFDGALSRPDDVRGLFNHDPNQLLGRSTAGTMRLAIDDVGLRFEIDTDDTQVGTDTVKKIRRGDLSGCSFSFLTTDEEWRMEKLDGKETWIREVRGVELFDVGPVTFPAYTATSVGVRSQKILRALARGDEDEARQALARHEAGVQMRHAQRSRSLELLDKES